MNSFRWVVLGIAVLIVVAVCANLGLTRMPGNTAPVAQGSSAANRMMIPADQLLRVPVTGVYPGNTTAGLNPNMANPLANDPDAAQRGMRDFQHFNCVGCHMPNGGGGMGPALSDKRWRYRDSAGNIYLDIAQGRGAGMPAFGGMLPDRTIWELVAYIQSMSDKPSPTFGTTTSASPPSPDKEQVPVENMQSATPWKFTEPMPPNGQRPGTRPENQ